MKIVIADRLPMNIYTIKKIIYKNERGCPINFGQPLFMSSKK